jgi:hypothetical protein
VARALTDERAILVLLEIAKTSLCFAPLGKSTQGWKVEALPAEAGSNLSSLGDISTLLVEQASSCCGNYLPRLNLFLESFRNGLACLILLGCWLSRIR